jgi:SAM-dependent methyltransferase
MTVRHQGARDGLPLPPSRLVHLVAGTSDLAWFLKGGALAAQCVRQPLASQGVAIEDLAAVLDFGCGCGRVARHWAGLDKKTLHGVDYNAELINWCRENLPFGQFSVNGSMPPLDFSDATFDLVYGFSVFTHMAGDMQDAWMAELHRVLKPGGHLVFSTHGERYLHHLSPTEQAAFNEGAMVVKPGGAVGTNLYQAYHSRRYIEHQLCSKLEPVAFTPAGALGNPVQDLHLFRRPRA